MDGGLFYDGVDGTIYDIPRFPCIYTLFEFILLEQDKMSMSSFVALTSDV
jgi:hypothetical protein